MRVGGTSGPPRQPPPRVLVIVPEQWPRALIRGALREAGYDAVGTRTLDTALRFGSPEPGRGSIRALLVDQHAIHDDDDPALAELLTRLGDPPVVLLAHATSSPPRGPWRRVIRRPMSVADAVAAARALVPLPEEAQRPLE